VALLEGESGAGKSALGFSEPVIAVLPFSDLSGDGTPAYLLDGLSDELSSLLALFDDIKVIDYFSMVKFRDRSIGIREVGRKLGADSSNAREVSLASDYPVIVCPAKDMLMFGSGGGIQRR
jgi:TolB-like protein